MATSPLRISRRKRILFTLVMLFSTLVAVELISFIGLRLADEAHSRDRLRQAQQSIAAGFHVSDAAVETIHPYLGWVHIPGSPSLQLFDHDVPVNELGFRDPGPGIVLPDPDTFVVGIAGGSVAWELSIEAEDLLRQMLSDSQVIGDKEIKFVRIAAPGYKQPQQLFALSYLMTLGTKFDAVINIDGYNEVALTLGENRDHETALVYPRAWDVRNRMAQDPQVSADAFDLLQLRATRQRLAGGLSRSIFRHSLTANLIWLIRDRNLNRQQTELGIRLLKSARKSFVFHGPQRAFPDDASAVEAAIDIWKNSSRQMLSLCEGQQCVYLHVLQPNQYDTGSKPFSRLELKDFVAVQMTASKIVARTYPALRQAGADLQQQEQLPFLDATGVFRNVPETLYRDVYCHYNKLGNRLLAEAIGQKLIQLLERTSAAQPPQTSEFGAP